MAHHHTTSNSMDINSSSSMDMGIFHWSARGDGLWLNSWIPQTEPAYIGACFGLFLISILSRSLPAFESYFVVWRASRNDSTLIASSSTAELRTSHEKHPDMSEESFSSTTYPKPLGMPSIPSFSWTTDTIRSFLHTLTAFVSYLLMMVVMTGNGGFFLVIILGIFCGEMAFGRYKYLAGASHVDHVH
ncbi:Ctr copper transporter family-domain-containing protein [Blakeslea trispora]|nr:Ctr copper transporter family-domain-containing protein [Blakeslea trispora]